MCIQIYGGGASICGKSSQNLNSPFQSKYGKFICDASFVIMAV